MVSSQYPKLKLTTKFPTKYHNIALFVKPYPRRLVLGSAVSIPLVTSSTRKINEVYVSKLKAEP